MISYEDFAKAWRVKRVHNIPTNPIAFIYVIVCTNGDTEGKIYTVGFQGKVSEEGKVLSEDPIYFKFGEGRCKKEQPSGEYEKFLYESGNVDGFSEDSDLITIYDDLNAAMKRAYCN